MKRFLFGLLFVVATAAHALDCASGASVTGIPGNAVSVTCIGTQPPITPPAPAPTTLHMTLVPATSTGHAGTPVTLTAASNMDASVAVTSTGCTISTSVVNISAGGSQTFSATGLANGTNCVVNLVTNTGTQATAAIPMVAVAGCPAVFATPMSFAGPGVPLPDGQPLTMPSGQVATIVLPSTAPYANATISMGYTAVTPPNPALYELSISPCKGVIASGLNGDPTPAAIGTTPNCYVGSANSTLVQMPWYQTATGPANACVADATRGPWYVSLRYTYSSCAYGACGEQVMWNY